MVQPPPSKDVASDQKQIHLDKPISGVAIMDYIGFDLISAKPTGVHGKFRVSETSCQPFGVLHGGVSAFIAEALSSMGAQIASNWERVAGIELNINHLRAAPLGQLIYVDATPLLKGRRIQVWEVKLSGETDQSTNIRDIFAVSRVTLVIGLPGAAKGAHFKNIVASKL